MNKYFYIFMGGRLGLVRVSALGCRLVAAGADGWEAGEVQLQLLFFLFLFLFSFLYRMH